MTIRTKLTLSVALMFAASLATLGYWVLRLEKANMAADRARHESLIVSTVQRAARDALVQRDEILLLSYVKFLRQQFPALAYVRVTWDTGGRTRSHHLGKKAVPDSVTSKRVRVRDPTDAKRGAILAVGIDGAVLDERFEEGMARFKRDLFRLFGIVLIVAILFSDWFSRKITKPLAELSRASAEIGRGKLGVRLDWKSKDEIGEFVKGFNTMSQRLEELDTMKRDFVSAVTHELRSPLGAIESFLSLMEGNMSGGQLKDPAQFKSYFGRIKENVRRLSSFISDLLDVAKIERGKMECALKPMRVQNVAADVVKFFEARSQEQDVTIVNRLGPDTAMVQGDSERLRQVFVNLISNALKFTPKGGNIWISAEQYREDGQKFLEVSVQDSGRGISAEDQAKLFEKFQQGKNTKQRIAGSHGTGLGLFIVKTIVEAHGGKVSVKSQPDKGSQFLFNLRMA